MPKSTISSEISPIWYLKGKRGSSSENSWWKWCSEPSLQHPTTQHYSVVEITLSWWRILGLKPGCEENQRNPSRGLSRRRNPKQEIPRQFLLSSKECTIVWMDNWDEQYKHVKQWLPCPPFKQMKALSPWAPSIRVSSTKYPLPHSNCVVFQSEPLLLWQRCWLGQTWPCLHAFSPFQTRGWKMKLLWWSLSHHEGFYSCLQ